MSLSPLSASLAKPPAVSSQTHSYAGRELGRLEWDHILLRFADAGLMQTGSYAAHRWGAPCRRFVIERAGGPVAAAQAVILRIPFVRAGLAHVKWGPMWRPAGASPNVEDFRQILRLLRSELAERENLLLRIYTPTFAERHPEALAVLLEEGFTRDKEGKPHRTVVLDLRLTLEELRASLKPEWRRNLRRAEQNPRLQVREGTEDELFGAFLSLYGEMQRRKGRPEIIDIGYYRAVQRDLAPEAKLRVMICQHGDVPVAGLAVSVLGDTALNLLAATGDTGLDLRGSYLLHWAMVRQLRSEGVRWYDLFGVNPVTTPGTYQFKTGLAGNLGRQLTYLGEFDYCSNGWSAAAVRTGEKIRAANARLRSVINLSNRISPWK